MSSRFSSILALYFGAVSTVAQAHIFINGGWRLGAIPPDDGPGWTADVYLNIPEASAEHLLQAEQYVATVQPDFTFATEWIDFPEGPNPVDLDSSFPTIGSLLGPNITAVSDPAKLNEPPSHMLIRFHGALRVRLADDETETVAMPVFLSFGVFGSDGFRVRIGETVFRIPLTQMANGTFFFEHAVLEVPGMYPFEVTLFNRYDPNETSGTEYVGIELYSFFPGGLPRPGGENMSHPVDGGPGTLLPPGVVFAEEDVLPWFLGDFDADHDSDADDAAWFEECFIEPVLMGCWQMDFDADDDVTCTDWEMFQDGWTPAGDPPLFAECDLIGLPAASDWGLFVLSLLVLSVGVIHLRRKRHWTRPGRVAD